MAILFHTQPERNGRQMRFIEIVFLSQNYVYVI